MNTQRSRIACIAGAILLIVGSVAFIAHDRDAPVEQIRIYELPEADTDGTGKTETLVSGQPTWRSDNNAAVASDELDSTDTIPHAETVIEPCCPDDEELTEIASGQDINLDHNPVTPELAADMTRDAEWFVAKKAWEKQLDALSAEGRRLEKEHDALLPDDPDEFFRTGDRQALIANLKASRAKLDAWWAEYEELQRQKPIQPTPTHKH